MDFEVVHNKEIMIVGKKITITFADSSYMRKIEDLWQEIFNNDILSSIRNKIDDKPVVVYFEQGIAGKEMLSVMIGYMTSAYKNRELDMVKLPESDYAKFTVKGQSMDHVIKAWKIITAIEVEQDTGIAYEIYHDDAETINARTLECFVSII